MTNRQFATLIAVLAAGFGSILVTRIYTERQEKSASQLADAEKNNDSVRGEFRRLLKDEILWGDISVELLRTIEASPHALSEEAVVMRDTIVALRRLGMELDRLAQQTGEYPLVNESLEALFGGSNLWWLRDGWGNPFFFSETPMPESRKSLFPGIQKDNYLKFTIISGGDDGKPFTGLEPYISGFYCYDLRKAIWCIPPEGPNCEFGLPLTLEESQERRQAIQQN